MMNHVAIKFAASTLVLGVTMVACKPAADASRPRSAAASAVKADQDSARLYAKAQEAVQKGNLAEALRFAEQAVETSPRDAGYRMLLGDLYLKNGRFASAETSFGDVLSLDPGNARAGLSAALAQIALGKTGAALSRLEDLSTTAPAADLGLAFALAGQPQRAVEMLEPAARAPGATGRVRQNLALAYALAGDWERARTTAAQDVSPAELGARMQQWAAFTSPSASSDQVATLLGVKRADDAGQPVRLALASPEPEPSAYAAAEVEAPQPAAAFVAEAPVEIAQAEVPQWAPPEPPVQIAAIETPVSSMTEPAEVEPEPEPSFVRAVQALVTPEPAIVRRASVTAIAPTFAPARKPALKSPRRVSTGPGRFVVQLGAYSTAASVERAWAGVYRRYGLGDHQPRSTTIAIAGRGTLHRLSVSGFDTHSDASRTCRSIKAKGGACFVRALAGDAPVRWASRYTSHRRA